MGAVVEADNVGKRYRLGELGAGTTLREAVTALLRPRRRSPTTELWALRDVSFELQEGDALGVIGRNGSGKSTLLRMLAWITEPTEGVVRTRGRVASLLEVGTGFHAELTGRDNIYLNGAIHGMTRRDVAARFDDIVEFAGVGRFLDTPIKRYSTGMELRLAFSVAAHLDPDILLVDEVLAVGDLEFQRRCMGRIQQVEREGRTVVFVSHDLAAVARLCRRVVWLEAGRARRDGRTPGVLDAYSSSFVAGLSGDGLATTAGPVTVERIQVLDADGRPVARVHQSRPFEVKIGFDVHEPCPSLDLAVYLTNQDGIRVLDEAWSDRDHDPITPGRWTARVRVPPVFHGGQYTVGLWIGTQYEDHLDEPAVAHVTLDGSARRPNRITHLDLPWSVNRGDGSPGQP